MRALIDRLMDRLYDMHVKAEIEHKRRLAEYYAKHPERRA